MWAYAYTASLGPTPNPLQTRDLKANLELMFH